MRNTAFLIAVAAFLRADAIGASVLEALEVLPKDELGSVARIEAYDGNPVPERWHILVHEPEAENGVREYVVADGKLVASRQISQFAERLRAADVIGSQPLQVDSDKLAKLAKDYAEANDVNFSTMSYQFGRQIGVADPAWRVRCMSETGQVLGTLVVNSQNGTVLSHEGFPSEPAPKSEKSKPSKRSQSSARVASRERFEAREPDPVASGGRKRSRRGGREASQDRTVRRAEPATEARGVGGFFRRIFRPRN